MTREIYEAMRRRVSVHPDVDEQTREELRLTEGGVIYFFDGSDLNAGYKDWDVDYVDSILHPMHTHNLWNVCQRFYSLIQGKDNINKRLLGTL